MNATQPATLATPRQPMTLRVTRGRSVKEHPIATVNEASEWWCRYRDEHNVGVSRSPRVEIVVNGVVRGRVAYNGKVFAGDKWQSGAVPVFDPYAASEAG